MLNRLKQYFHRHFRANEVALHELNYLFWECTQRCNLLCLHCGSDCVANSQVKDMPFEDFLGAILPLQKRYKPNSITVVITGGEPLLRTDLAQCGLTLRRNGFRWGIVTNGMALTPEKFAELLAAGIGAITLSLDGLADTHNWLRNNSQSFDRALAALDLIVSKERLQSDVVTCVNKRNLSQLAEIKELLIAHSARAWRLFTIAPIGRAQSNNDTQLTAEELHRLMQFIAEASTDTRLEVTFSCEAYVGNYEKKVRDSYFFCRAGVQIASVLVDGSISACPNINREFSQGSIYRDNFLDVWENRFQLMRDRRWTKRGVCSTCREYANCNGGALHLWDEKQDEILCCMYQQLQSKK